MRWRCLAATCTWGGQFSQTGDGTLTDLGYIARYDIAAYTWHALPNEGLGNPVLALAVVGDDLHVGGLFTQTGDGTLTDLGRIARYDTVTNTWNALPNQGLKGSYSPSVRALTVSSSDLYVGGGFSQTGDGTLTNLGYVARGALALPEIQVLDGAANIADGTGTVNLGATLVGKPIDKTFTVSNTGTADLTLIEPISVPTGFSVANSFGGTTVTAGNSTTFTVRLDAVAEDTYSGTLQFANNDADEDPFNFTISGSATTSGVFLPAILRQPAPLITLYVTNQTTGLVLYYTVHGTPEGDITCTNIPAGTTAWCGSFTPGTYQVSVDTVECGPSSGQVIFAAGSTTRIVSCQ